MGDAMKSVKLFGFLAMIFLAANLGMAAPQQSTGMNRGMLHYNPATETTLKGTVEEVKRFTPGGGWTGTHVVLKTDKGPVDVHMGPSSFLAEKQFTLAKGDQIEVTGSETKYNGTEVLIARQVKKGNQVLTLRNANGVPLWSGRERSSMGPGMGSGMGRGMGGMMGAGMGPGMGPRMGQAPGPYGGMQNMMVGVAQMMQDPLRGAAIRAFFLPSMAKSLGLSSTQVQKLDQMKEQFVTNLQNTWQQIADKRAAVDRLFESGSPNVKQAEKLEMDIAKLEVQQRVSGYETLKKMEAVLTPAQRTRFSSLTPQEIRNDMMANMTVADMTEMMRLMHGSMGSGAMMGGSGRYGYGTGPRPASMGGMMGGDMGGMGQGMGRGMGHMGMGQSPASSASSSPGEQVFASNCVMCHNANSTATKAGPGLKGLYAKSKLTNGKKVTDQNVRNFLEKSHPGMPSFANRLTKEQMDQLITYLKTL
jgi:mono/diheme cytochrome c family protein